MNAKTRLELHENPEGRKPSRVITEDDERLKELRDALYPVLIDHVRRNGVAPSPQVDAAAAAVYDRLPGKVDEHEMWIDALGRRLTRQERRVMSEAFTRRELSLARAAASKARS